jgi:protein-tyrosine phosphatase
MDKTKLLFVCLGNICRSPSAENLMNHLIQQEGLSHKFELDSAGTSSYHIGSPPDRRMKIAARKRGIELKGRARQIEDFDLEYYDLILAMDQSNYHNILSLDPRGKYHHKIKLMCDFATQYKDQEVPDPYYGGESGFDYVIDLLLDSCQGLLNYCRSNYNL